MNCSLVPAERDSIGRFLQGRINSERAADDAAPWQDICTCARLPRVASIRHSSGFKTVSGKSSQSKPTVPVRRREGSHSDTTAVRGGCSALSKRCSVRAALILLDEAFIGIDKPTRARLMGLLVSFDLDFVMTSELEWGCYATLPALGICQLATRPESPAVYVTRWVWNGANFSSELMETAPDAARFRALFEQPGLRWILDRLVERMSPRRPLIGAIVNSKPTQQEAARSTTCWADRDLVATG